MAEFPIPEAAANPEALSHRKGQIGVALEPEVVRICVFSLLVAWSRPSGTMPWDIRGR